MVKTPIAALFIAIWSLTTQAQNPTALFMTEGDEPLQSYKANRRMEGRNKARFGWLEVTTELSREGKFSYRILSQGGSGSVINRALKPLLEGEVEGSPTSSALTVDNYNIGAVAKEKDYLVSFQLKPRRKEVGLIEGAIFLDKNSFELIRIEGRPAKDPSFWTSREFVIKNYERINGVRIPVKITITGSIRFGFGESDVTILCRYQEINGKPVQ